MDSDVCVCVIAYQAFDKLTSNELVSWRQCLQILGARPIFIVCPEKLSTKEYIADAASFSVICEVVTFNDKYFLSVDSYNELMLKKIFYQKFADYKFILIHQLDVFVFRDELDYWCNKGYSYIGAPWFFGYIPQSDDVSLWKVGNGGFALRSVSDSLRVLQTFATARNWPEVLKSYLSAGLLSSIKNLPKLIKTLTIGNNTHWLMNDFHKYRALHQEDYFWGVICEKFTWYRVPTPQEALKFSFEVAPSRMFELNNQQLPMGCHAWEKYEPKFWAPFIKHAIESKYE